MIPLFSLLPDAAIEWIAEASTERRIASHEVIIRDGEQPKALYIVLEGVLGIYPTLDGPKVALAGPGSVLGDMSMLNDDPASASVKAEEACLVLELPRELLLERLRREQSFAAEFYRAVAVVLSQRVREANRHHLAAHSSSAEFVAIDPVSRAMEFELDGFRRTMTDLDRTLLRRPELSEAEYERFAGGVNRLVSRAHELLGPENGLGADASDRLGTRMQQELLPYLLTTETGERFYSKPRGYAGDYLSIQNIYRNQPAGTGRLGPLFDRLFLDLVPARVVRNRRKLMTREILAALGRANGKPISILCMAAGPAAELFDAIVQSGARDRISATLVDIDLQALSFVEEVRNRLRLEERVSLVNQNLIALSLGHGSTSLGKFDLIYSIGLVDYLNDKLVVRVLNWAYQQLVPGGRVVLGNFHPRNAAKEFMASVLEWHIFHRSEEDMSRLFQASAFARGCTRTVFEEEEIGLFAECIRG